MRYRIRRGIFRPLLTVLGGTAEGSYVDVGPAAVRFRFGFLFDEEIPRAELARVRRSRWPWYGGIGWRLGVPGVVGLIGSLDGIVEIELREPRRVRFLGIPLRCRRVFVSLEDPGGFLRELAG